MIKLYFSNSRTCQIYFLNDLIIVMEFSIDSDWNNWKKNHHWNGFIWHFWNKKTLRLESNFHASPRIFILENPSSTSRTEREHRSVLRNSKIVTSEDKWHPPSSSQLFIIHTRAMEAEPKLQGVQILTSQQLESKRGNVILASKATKIQKGK